ncbi:MAG: hypothetical protein KTR24_17730 [Saprospiraceae bacterium]|nr:hypothetical protein [Saprospiraceae bacterium]
MKTVFKGLLVASIVLAIGCNKDSDDDGPDTASLVLDFSFKSGAEDVALGETYTINGTAIDFEAINYYVGGLKLTQENGNTVDIGNQYLLAGIGNTASLQGTLEISNFSDAVFFVGVDETTNAQTEADFTSRPPGDPLGIQDPAMHWNWMTGYKFLRIDGNVDVDGDGTTETPVAYHLGSAAMLKNLSFTETISISKGANTVTFELDLAKLFANVDLTTELDTHTGNNLPLAERLRDNLEQALDLK